MLQGTLAAFSQAFCFFTPNYCQARKADEVKILRQFRNFFSKNPQTAAKMLEMFISVYCIILILLHFFLLFPIWHTCCK